MSNTKRKIVISVLIAAMLFLAAAIGLLLKPDKVYADNGLEIVSAGGNPVKREAESGDFDLGSLPMGWLGEPYSAKLGAEGGSGKYIWSISITYTVRIST